MERHGRHSALQARGHDRGVPAGPLSSDRPRGCCKAKPAVRVAVRSGVKSAQAAAPQRSTKVLVANNRKTLHLAAR